LAPVVAPGKKHYESNDRLFRRARLRHARL
jgi:hypothetical protein